MLVKAFTSIIQEEDGSYVSFCPELDIASQGETIKEAKQNLVEAVQLFFETALEKEVEERVHSETYISPLEISIG